MEQFLIHFYFMCNTFIAGGVFSEHYNGRITVKSVIAIIGVLLFSLPFVYGWRIFWYKDVKVRPYFFQIGHYHINFSLVDDYVETSELVKIRENGKHYWVFYIMPTINNQGYDLFQGEFFDKESDLDAEIERYNKRIKEISLFGLHFKPICRNDESTIREWVNKEKTL